MTGILALKLFLVPGLIYAVTLAGRTWGPTVAGWLSAFPIVAGPILLTITLEQGSDFGATAAGGTLLAVLAMLVFNLAYAWASAIVNIFWSMSYALAAWALAVVALQAVDLSVSASFVLVALALLVALKVYPKAHPLSVSSPPTASEDLPWRMLSAADRPLERRYGAARRQAPAHVFGSVTPRWPWYLPPRSLYEVSQTSSDSRNSICATPSFA